MGRIGRGMGHESQNFLHWVCPGLGPPRPRNAIGKTSAVSRQMGKISVHVVFKTLLLGIDQATIDSPLPVNRI
jgi:hypothetical protein